ncbi:MAG: prenyltransferase, partial [Deltaproteobacteria bacterium]|nr:prenyltransferase [Nannocystaceae bacterium]
ARCLSALEPRRWPGLLAAALLGQSIGVVAAQRFDAVAALIGFAFTLLALAFGVLLSAWLDRDLDALKRRLDPEGVMPRTIPDRILEGRSVWQLGAGLGAFALSAAVVAEILVPRPGAWWGAALCMLLLAIPSLPPLRLGHRGAGELLEMLAIGFAVPWWNAYLQSGISTPAELAFLPGFALFTFAVALAAGLSDEHGDRLGGRITFTTLFGAERVRIAAEGMLIGGMLVWAAMSKLAPHIAAWWTTAPAVLLMSWLHREVAKIGRSADIDTPSSIARYRAALERCIIAGVTVLAFTLLGHLWIDR